MGVFQDILDGIRKFAEWIKGGEAADLLEKIADVALMVVSVIDMFNDPLSPDRKRETAWNIMRFLKHAELETLEKIVELKKTGALDKVGPHHIDLVMGIALSSHVREKRRRAGKAV